MSAKGFKFMFNLSIKLLFKKLWIIFVFELVEIKN